MIVVIAEKPSVARDLARMLKATQRRDGMIEGNGYCVTWALGHLVELQEPHQYDAAWKKWQYESLPMIPDQFKLRVIDRAAGKKQFRIVNSAIQKAEQLICATDAGREGELIFRYIQQLSGAVRIPTRRLWLSSLTDSAIRAAWANLQPLSRYDALYSAARCRSESDWLVGLNATRAYTIQFGQHKALWSVGRVQTPVLAMIVGRDDEIRNFKIEPFYEVHTNYRDTRFKHETRFTDQNAAIQMLEKVSGKPLVVKDVKEKQERIPPPLLYDLTSLQRDMNRRYHLSAAATLKIAQSLYEAKWITYPRTDSRYLSNDMRGQLPKILGKLEKRRPNEIAKLDLQQLSITHRIINDAKVTDHHALIPTGKTGHLSDAERKVYEAIETQFIAAFYPACEKLRTIVTAESATIPFLARGVRVVKQGWTKLFPKPKAKTKTDDAEVDLSVAFQAGEQGPHKPFIHEGKTQPPKAFNEGSLLSAMETCGRTVTDEEVKEALRERGLGTPATRAQIIETLLARGYIERLSKNLAATAAGRYLISLITTPGLKSPELTGEWEAKLKAIEAGTSNAESFLGEIRDYTTQIVRNPTAVDSDRIGNCPKCDGAIIEGARGFGCANWKQGCDFVLWKKHRHLSLTQQQAREILQLGRLVDPIVGEVGGPALLTLCRPGVLQEIPMVVADQNRPGGQRARSGRSSSDSTERSGKRSNGAAKSAESIGPCPTCGAPIIQSAKAFGCSAWKAGCKFTIWKKIAGKTISAKTATTLLKSGKTSVLKGFKSKAGRAFEATLVLEDGEVKLKFNDDRPS